MMLEFVALSVIGIMSLFFVALAVDFVAYIVAEKPRKNRRK